MRRKHNLPVPSRAVVVLQKRSGLPKGRHHEEFEDAFFEEDASKLIYFCIITVKI